MRRSYLAGATFALALTAPAPGQPVSAADVNQLKDEVRRLRERVQRLESEVARLKGGSAPVKGALAARFSAAEAVSNHSDQQAAFAVLAVEAARAGDVKLTRQALGRLVNHSVNQEQTYKAALHLARAGQAEEAVALAKSLGNFTQNQKALAKIAKGEVDD